MAADPAAYPAPAPGRPCPDGQPVAFLADGTPCFAPVGQVVAEDGKVRCHLCGRSFRSVAAHLRSHGWTKQDYCAAFGLERSQSLEGTDTRKLRSASFSARLVFEPALRDGSARGRELARTGELTRAAAAAARGRQFPEQRRQRSRAAVPEPARRQLARANAERAAGQAAEVAATAAASRGYADFRQLVRDGLAAGQSLAGISRGCGLDPGWLSRHLERLDPLLAAAAAARRADRADVRWLPALRRLGFSDVEGYLRQRHCAEHMSVNAIAREAGVSFPAVKSALERHGLQMSAHEAKRHEARHRAAEVAGTLGVSSVGEYVLSCREAGQTWRQIAAATGQPQSWLRRQAQKCQTVPVGSPAAEAVRARR